MAGQINLIALRAALADGAPAGPLAGPPVWAVHDRGLLVLHGNDWRTGPARTGHEQSPHHPRRTTVDRAAFRTGVQRGRAGRPAADRGATGDATAAAPGGG